MPHRALFLKNGQIFRSGSLLHPQNPKFDAFFYFFWPKPVTATKMFPYIPFRTFQNEYLGSLVIIFIPGVSQNYYKNQTLGPHKSGLREPILLVHGNSGQKMSKIIRVFGLKKMLSRAL